MKYNFQEIGERIRKLRKEKYKNQEDFGDALREMDVPISRNTISGIENGVEGKFSWENMGIARPGTSNSSWMKLVCQLKV